MLSMGVHRVEVPASCRTIVTQPDDVENLTRQRGTSIAVRIPASMLDSGCVIWCLASKIHLYQIWQAVVGLSHFRLPDEIVLSMNWESISKVPRLGMSSRGRLTPIAMCR